MQWALNIFMELSVDEQSKNCSITVFPRMSSRGAHIIFEVLGVVVIQGGWWSFKGGAGIIFQDLG